MVRRWISIVAALVITIIVLIALAFYLAVRFIPFQASELEKVHQPSIVYAEDGTKLMSLGSPATDLAYGQIPKNVQNAIVATEDHSFWTNSGVDLKSVVRSVFVDTLSGSLEQGASTIPEQLAKMVYLTDKKTFTRKFEQIVLGVQIERNFTKQEILAMYLNRIPLGEGSTGIEQGAQRYFGIDLKKNPNKLTLADAALLAGLPQAPSAYDPIQHPKAALTRRNQVLENMAHWGYISESQAKQAEKAPLGIVKSGSANSNDGWDTNPLLTNFLLDYLSKHNIPPEEVEQGGLKIYTTISPAVQNAINEVFWSGKYDSDFPGPTSGTVVQGAAVFVDPKTGGILGAAGSRHQDFTPLGLDRVYSGSSPGSSIKPIMEYAPALESGKWSYTSILDNAPQDFGDGYEPSNWEVGGPSKVTLQYALEESQNIASVWLLQQIGLSTGVNFAEKDGIQLSSSARQHLGIAIGGEVNVTPLQMAGAYTPFANQGVRSQPYLINKIVNAQGTILYHESPSQSQIMSSQTATDMTRLMQDVVDYGTGQYAKLSNWGVAGKTGTVQYDPGLNGSHDNWIRDGWFDGYTPTLVGSIHIGYDQTDANHHMTMTPEDPSGNAAQIFHDIIALALQNEQPQQFAEGPYPYNTGTADGINYANQNQAPSTKATGIQGLTASYDAAKNQVSLSWQGGFPTTVTYAVTRQTVGSSDQIPVGETQGTSMIDTAVQPGQVYQYTVQATDPNSGSALGTPATVTVQTGAVQTPPGSGQGNNTTTPGVGPGTSPGQGDAGSTPPSGIPGSPQSGDSGGTTDEGGGGASSGDGTSPGGDGPGGSTNDGFGSQTWAPPGEARGDRKSVV